MKSYVGRTIGLADVAEELTEILNTAYMNHEARQQAIRELRDTIDTRGGCVHQVSGADLKAATGSRGWKCFKCGRPWHSPSVPDCELPTQPKAPTWSTIEPRSPIAAFTIEDDDTILKPSDKGRDDLAACIRELSRTHFDFTIECRTDATPTYWLVQIHQRG